MLIVCRLGLILHSFGVFEGRFLYVYLIGDIYVAFHDFSVSCGMISDSKGLCPTDGDVWSTHDVYIIGGG